MKIKLLAVILTVFLFSFFAHASSSPDGAEKKNTLYITAIPEILYFNQDYVLTLAETKGSYMISAMIEEDAARIEGNAIHLFVPYSNNETTTRTIKVYDGDKLVTSKTVSVIQKLKDNVCRSTDLFKLNDRVIDIDQVISPEQIKEVKSLDVNPERFNAPGLHISGFIIRMPTINVSLYNEGSTLSEATREAISKLMVGDIITIDKIHCTYFDGDQNIPLDINYTINITVSPDM